jgi:hypothetical protein
MKKKKKKLQLCTISRLLPSASPTNTLLYPYKNCKYYVKVNYIFKVALYDFYMCHPRCVFN